MLETEENTTQVKRLVKKIGIWAGVIFLGLALSSMIRNVETGYTDFYQNTLTGNTQIYHGPDLYFSPIFIGKESTWKDDTSAIYSNTVSDDSSATARNGAIGIRFADTYEADLPLKARFVLPADDIKMKAVVKSFRTYKNLVDALYIPTMVDVVVNSAQQFTAEEVTQGGLNGLKSAIEDQANNGVYVTERKRVIVNTSSTKRIEPGADKTDTETSQQEITVWKAVPKLDRDNKRIRTSNPFEKYGIKVLQVNLEDPVPEQLLETLLVAKKTSVAKKILSVQKQDNAKEDIKTAKLEGQAKRETAEQERLIVADAEIIEKKKEVELAGLQAKKEIVDRKKLASLAVIDKKKDLQISTANLEIEKANERAAKFSAQASLHKGLADAQIKKAMYEAVRKDILELEVTKVVEVARYEAMKVAKVEMPDNVTIMGSNGEGASVDTLTNFAILGMKDSLKK